MNIGIHHIKEIKKGSIHKLEKNDGYHRTIEITAEVEDFINKTKTEQTISISLFSDNRRDLVIMGGLK